MTLYKSARGIVPLSILIMLILAPLAYMTSRNSLHVIKPHRIAKRNANGTKVTNQCVKATTCEACIGPKHYDCLWCRNGNKCTYYPFKHVFPQDKDCSWADARWGVCWIDFRAMLISVSVIFGVIILVACCCIVKFCRCVTDCCHCLKACLCCCEDGDSRTLKRLERRLKLQSKQNELVLKYSTAQRNQNVPYGSMGNYTAFENEPT